MNKKQWAKPVLIVLIRGLNGSELVLTTCKASMNWGNGPVRSAQACMSGYAGVPGFGTRCTACDWVTMS